MIRSTVLPRRESKRMREGDGVIGAAGTIAGRPVYCYAQDQSFAGGSLGEAHAETIVRVMELAGRAGAPVIGFVASGGARMDDGVAALGGYGRIFRETVAAVRQGAADLGDHRRVRRRRRVLAGAHRLRRDDRRAPRCSSPARAWCARSRART